MVDLVFDLICSELALGFGADPPQAARPIVDLLRELAAERIRHLTAITELRERLLALTKSEATHHDLNRPIEYYQEWVRDWLLPNLKLRPVQNSAHSGER